MCANEFFYIHSHTKRATHVFVLSCHYVTTDTRFIIICRPVWVCVCVRVCVFLSHILIIFYIKIHLLSIYSGKGEMRATLELYGLYSIRRDTHSNLLSKLNLRLADQFNNMNHMERFALERCAFARK